MSESPRQLVIVRHGETEWSLSGQHTGLSDIPLTPRGEEQARDLLDNVGQRDFAAVLVSPRQRAWRTAELAGIEEFDIVDELAEWDYGDLDGLTTAEYVSQLEDAGLGPWNLWRDGAPNGEHADAVGARVDRVIERVRPVLLDDGDGTGDVLVVAHSHLLCVFVARWLGLPAAEGEGFLLDAAHRSVLTFKRGRPVIKYWNVPPTR
ncbi:acid phosphatase [Georgenia halophila]|uniref:Acid phosphatase n=1 Tax=Georgenia halophila TaxID=620889 RepID=A0ABP8LCW4_9MICO